MAHRIAVFCLLRRASRASARFVFPAMRRKARNNVRAVFAMYKDETDAANVASVMAEWAAAVPVFERLATLPEPLQHGLFDEAWHSKNRKTLGSIPLLKTNAGPRDPTWAERQKEELLSLIAYVKKNKEGDNDWFRLESNANGTKWFGKCWTFVEGLRYEFDVEFEIPVTYPSTAPEIMLPGLDGKTAKMYRGGKICLTDHFYPLWARNVVKFGLAHAMALGLAPWLAVEIPDMIAKGTIKHGE